MKKTAVIAPDRFRADGEAIAAALDACFLPYSAEVFAEAFSAFSGIVALMSAGIVTRKIAPLLKDKWHDPAVVVVSPDMRYAIPLVGGHHGANDLARQLASLGMVPVITTATEALGRPSVEEIARQEERGIVNRDVTRAINTAFIDGEVPVYPISSPGIVIAGPGVAFLASTGDHVVGIGCRKGVSAEEVVEAIREAFALSSLSDEDILVYATTSHKIGEIGLFEGVSAAGGNLVYLEDATLMGHPGPTGSKASRIGLVGVAEPAALALSRKKELVLQKHVKGRVTIAIAH